MIPTDPTKPIIMFNCVQLLLSFGKVISLYRFYNIHLRQ